MLAAAADLAEAPALVALLLQPPRRLACAGAHATLLDLAARGVLVLDEAAGTIQATAAHPRGLTSFEYHVFYAVTARARDRCGPHPLGAVDLGSQKQAKQWREQFVWLVIQAGRARGLVRPRVRTDIRVALWSLLTLALAFVIVPAWQAGNAAQVAVIVLGAAVMTVPMRKLAQPIPHGRGVGLAAGYARLRTGGGISLADRRLAHAVAAGAHVPGLSQSPFAPTKRPIAWSHRDGTWRRIQIVQGHGSSFGRSPRRALLSFPGGLVFLAIGLMTLTGYSLDLDSGQVAQVWPPLVIVAGWQIWILGLLVFGRFAYRTVFDLTHPVQVVAGPVIYLESDNHLEYPSCHVAVDDGPDIATGYSIGVKLYRRLRKDMWLRLEVTPKLGHVHRADTLEI